MNTLSQIITYIENLAPLPTQENWDNSGWQVVQDKNTPVSKILVTLSISGETIDEAISKGCNLIISHHPLIFSPLRNVSNPLIFKAIANNISIYSAHTNWDKYKNGINCNIADLLGLKNTGVLIPETNLYKLVTFVPKDHAEKVLAGLYNAGCGQIGDYDHCSYSTAGEGRFRPLGNASPFIGTVGQDELVEEMRIETIFEGHNMDRVIDALLSSHPYQTPAYDIIKSESPNTDRGLGLLGIYRGSYNSIIEQLKTINPDIRSNNLALAEKEIYKVAILLGSGAGHIKDARRSGADIYITGDMKYHDAELATSLGIKVFDIGHYEGESHGMLGMAGLVKKKFDCGVFFSKAKGYIINE